MNSPTDKQLMMQVRDGDLNKLGILFERHHKMLFNYFLRLTGSRSGSEDLVQEVFFKILKYRHTYRGESKFTVWMFRIARNARVDYLKKRKRKADQDVEQDTLLSEDANPGQKYEQKQEIQLLRLALSRLQSQDREVLLLSRFQNIKYKEIAEILGCLEGTVKARVHRATKKLRDIFWELSGEKGL